MITALELAKFAEKNGWIVIAKEETSAENYIRFLTLSGQTVMVTFYQDGSIQRIIS